MESKRRQVRKRRIARIRLINIIAIFLITVIVITLFSKLKSNKNKKNPNFVVTPEILRSREYEQVQAGDEATNSNYVKFDAFFLKDLNGDGEADSIRGTCNEIGKEDTLYMELNVINNGYLKDGVITINSDNFYLNTTIVKDSNIAQNCISDNTKQIKLNNIQNGTQRLLTGIVRSGIYNDNNTITLAIGNDTTKYSKVNNITIAGIHVADNGTETVINKTINFDVDWYGTTSSKISTTNVTNYVNSMDELIEGENIKLEFEVNVEEEINQLILKGNYLEGTIPELNGYKPTSVEIKGDNISYTYDENTNKFTAKREAVVNENGILTTFANNFQENITRYNTYKFNIVYPREAYDDINNSNIELFIPIKTWYEGYNNPNNQFTNPYISNISETTIPARWVKYQGDAYRFDINVGKWSTFPYKRNVISKEKPIKIYNNMSEIEKEDYYEVEWNLTTGEDGIADKVIMKETKNGETQVQDNFIRTDSSKESMEDLTSNVGIYFIGQESMLGENGWIKVINDETDELIETFNKGNWGTYNLSNPYKYENSIKHIRIETSSTAKNSQLRVYNIKELDDVYITTNYTKEEFDELQHIRSTLTGYFDESSSTQSDTAVYEVPMSVAQISIDQTKFSTQETATNQKIKIYANQSGLNSQKWKNGTFLVKIPSEILNMQINSVIVTNSNVKIIGYNLYEENGSYFIKILTENEEEQEYNIVIDCNITPDPRTPTVSEDIELYAINEQACEYAKNYKSEDIYDLDGDQNTTEIVNKSTKNISFISPNVLLTYQMASNYDAQNNITVAPKVAKTDKNQRTADIEISVSNNYSEDVTDVIMQGVIPFEGNKYIIGNEDMGSEYSTWMSDTGIIVPESLENVVTVYYSEEENPTKDINDTNNKWTLAENVTDWSKIKAYIIDFGNYQMHHGENYIFKYQINIPEGIEYNEITYSEHAIYFSLMTAQGKYSTSTAPSKLGFMIAKQYDLEITKYQEDTEKVLPGITFFVTEEGKEEGNIEVTNSNGKAKITGLYAERTYILKELKTTEDYVLNEEEIKIYTYTDEQDKLYVAYKNDNNTYSNLEEKYDWIKSAESIKEEEEDYKIAISLENEVKPRLKIIKIGNQSNEKLSNVFFKIKGEGIDETKATDSNGELIIKGLYQDKEYTVTETRKQGYYQISPVKFKIINNNGNYSAQIINGNLKEQNTDTVNSIPQINLTLENEKIPTYNLEVTKIEENHEDKKLENTEFMLIGEDDNSRKKLITNENGIASIEDLYQFVNGKEITGKYTLQETKASNGYSTNSEEISFVVSENEGNLEINIENESNLTSLKTAEVDGNTIKLTIENKPLFKLTKTDKETNEPLANAKFIIYEIQEDGSEIDYAKDVNGNYVGTLNSKNQYEIITDENGEISLPLRNGIYRLVEIEAPTGYDKNPAEEIFKITGNEEQEVGTPDEFDNTLEINYIEDLVDLSEDVRNGTTYSGTKVILKRTLDFSDNNSYRDATNTTTYGDYNLDGNIEDIKTELTTGIGFRGIGVYNSSLKRPFSGIFDGQGNEINGIYINYRASTPANPAYTEDNYVSLTEAALFRYVKDGKIKRLGTSGNIKGSSASGLVSYGDNIEIYSCYNNCNIDESGNFAGILYNGKTNVIIEKCTNNAVLNGGQCAGIMYGTDVYSSLECVIIKSCENTANLNLKGKSGSIFSTLDGSNVLVDDCKNYGDITFTTGYGSYAGAIGYAGNNSEIRNCINYGNIYCNNVYYLGGIVYSRRK